nr:EpsG family protein [uncultured Butyrivibrio sp.]
MSFYNALFLVLLLTGVFTLKYDKDKKVLMVGNEGNALIPIIILFVIQGFRSLNVGNDTYKYARFFLHADDPGRFRYSNGKDILYYAWCRIIKMVGSNVVFFNCCCAFVIFSALYFFISRYSSNKTLSVILFLTLGLFFASMNQTRQAMAASMLLWAFDRAYNKDIKLTLLFCFAAITIHSTTIVFLPIFLFISVFPMINKYIVAVFSCGAVIIVVFMRFFLEIFGKLFPFYARYFTNSLFRIRGVTFWRYGDWGICIIIQIGLLLCLLGGEEDLKKNRLGYVFACINSITLAISYLAMSIMAMERIKQYFMYWYIVMIPYVIATFLKKNKFIGIIIAFMSLLYMWHLGVRDGHGVIPYITVLENYIW